MLHGHWTLLATDVPSTGTLRTIPRTDCSDRTVSSLLRRPIKRYTPFRLLSGGRTLGVAVQIKIYQATCGIDCSARRRNHDRRQIKHYPLVLAAPEAVNALRESRGKPREITTVSGFFPMPSRSLAV